LDSLTLKSSSQILLNERRIMGSQRRSGRFRTAPMWCKPSGCNRWRTGLWFWSPAKRCRNCRESFASKTFSIAASNQRFPVVPETSN